MFLCPHCAQEQQKTWLTCFFRPIAELPLVPEDHPLEWLRGRGAHRLMFYEALRDLGHPDPEEGSYHDVVSCKKSIAWGRTGDDLCSISITPSIDASASGHWHGFVTNGEIR